MLNSPMLAFLLVTVVLTPGAALGQGAMELAMAGPQPHFVAAWAPKKEREAERSAVLAGRVSLELRDVSLDAALKALTNQAGLRITYSRAMLPAGKRVTISARDVAVVTAMTEMLFRSGLDVVVDRDGALALVECRHPGVSAEVQDSGTIVGAVFDKASGMPLVGATVVLEGTEWHETTANGGRYRIAGVKPGTHVVRARYIGYAARSISVTVTEGGEAAADFRLEKSVQRLDDVVTTGTVVPTEVKALPTPISVITASDLAQLNPRAVRDVFRQAVPTGVGWDFPTAPNNTSYSARGANTLSPGSGQMKVFVDGIEAALSSRAPVDVSSIERIEVVRGPQAATLYGSDAIGGVVQIFTKRGDSRLSRPEVEARASLGVVETPYQGFSGVLRQDYRASVRGGAPGVSYSLGGGYSHTADYVPNDEISRQSSPSVHGGIRFARGAISLDVSGRYDAFNAPPNVLNPTILQSGFAFFSKPFFLPGQIQNQTMGVRIAAAPTSWWSNTLIMGLDRLEQDIAQTRTRLTSPEDTLLQIFEESRAKRSIAYNTSVTGALSRQLAGSVTVGLDHYSLPITQFFTSGALNTSGPIQPGPGQALSGSRIITHNTGYFAQAQLGFQDALFLTGGIRAEQNTNFGDSLGTPLSPRVGISYVKEIGRTTVKLRGSYGKAIQPPAPGTKLAAATSATTTLANPELGPERQKGWDTGIDATFGSLASISVTYYHQTASGLIQSVLVRTMPVQAFQFQNVGRVKNTGVEIEGTFDVGPTQIRGQYGYARSRVERLDPTYTGDLRVGDQSFLTPRHTAGVTAVAAPFSGMTMSAGLTYVGSWTNYDFLGQFQCFGGTGPCKPTLRDYQMTYPSFTKLNALFSQRLSVTLSGFVSIDNITDNEAFEALNLFPVTGRVTTVGLQFRY